MVEERPVLGEDADSHHSFNHRELPVAIVAGVVPEHWDRDGLHVEHIVEGLRILRGLPRRTPAPVELMISVAWAHLSALHAA